MADVARTAAFAALKRVEQDGAFSNLATQKLLELSPLDKSFATMIVMGVLETNRALDFLIGRYAKRMPRGDLLLLLRMGIYQLYYMDRVPDSASCNETVTLAKRFCGEKQAGFVNLVLRSLCREKEAAWACLCQQPEEIRYSFGDGVASLLREQYPDNYGRIMESFGHHAPLHLRVNTLKAEPSTIAERLGAEQKGSMLILQNNHSEALKHLEDGEYFVQGYGSQMTVSLLDAQPGDTVIDVCACPGGKSLGTAISMENCGRIISMDLHGNKLSLITKSASKLGISIIETKKHDGRKADPSMKGIADKVICDVPCSGLGVMGAKPEIRYKDPKDFEGLYETQRAILRESASYVKDGGVLVYSTCTLNKIENEEAVKAFLEENRAFVPEKERTWFPYEDAHEGFYAVRLVKKNG